MRVANPHDALMKRFLSDLDKARALLDLLIPPELWPQLDLGQLRPEPASFIDENLRDFYSDYLFTVPDFQGRPRRIWLLFEHKSNPDPGLPFQLLVYLAHIYRVQPEKGLTLPLLFCHGRATLAGDRRFFDAIGLTPEEADPWHPWVPDFQPVFADVGRMELDRVRAGIMVQALLETLRRSRDGDPTSLRRLFEVLELCLAETRDTQFLHTLLVYLYRVSPLPNDQLTRGVVNHCNPQMEVIMRTAADDLIEQGWEKAGRKAGRKARRKAGKRVWKPPPRRSRELAYFLLSRPGPCWGSTTRVSNGPKRNGRTVVDDWFADRVMGLNDAYRY